MIENVRKYPSATVVGLSLYYTVGVIGLSLEMTRNLFQSLIPFTILLSLYFLWLFHQNPGRKSYIAWLVIFLAGYFVEVLGVNTGVIFGVYEYGNSLGFKLLETPLIIGANWLLLIYSCYALVGILTRDKWLGALAGSALMVLYDFALEPIAIKFDMWNWHLAPVPIQNYVAWFLVSFLFFMIFNLFIKKIENKIAPAVFIIQFMFFIILNVINYFT